MSDEAKPKERDINQKAFSFACRVVGVYRFLSKQGGAGEIIGRQLLRSGTSIGANLEEAASGQSRADFISKCSISLKEARETFYWIRLLRETQNLPLEKTDILMKDANELVAILTAIVKNSRKAEQKSV